MSTTTTTTTAPSTMTLTQTESKAETRNYTRGEHYVEIDEPIDHAPPVIVFFSFLDPKSKDWALESRLTDTIRRHVPQGVEIARYHSSSSSSSSSSPLLQHSSSFARDLSYAWSAAESAHMDDRVLAPLFKAVQGDARASDLAGVKVLFDRLGFDLVRFETELAKPGVRDRVEWVDECCRRRGVLGRDRVVPAVVVAGRWRVLTERFEVGEEGMGGEGIDAERVADLVKVLLELPM